MKKYLKYTWTMLLAAIIWNLLGRVIPSSWSESMVASVVTFVIYLIILYNFQIIVVKWLKKDENKASVAFAQVLPPFIIVLVVFWIGIFTDGDSLTAMGIRDLVFNPLVVAFLVIIWGISIGVVTSGINNTLKDSEKWEDHKNDKWLLGKKVAKVISMLVVVGLIAASFAALIVSGQAFNNGPDITEKLGKIQKAMVLEKKDKINTYPEYYGGAYWSYRSYEKNVKAIYIKPLVEEDEEDYCVVILTQKMDLPKKEIEKLKALGEEKETSILLKKCDHTLNYLTYLERQMDQKLERYVSLYPNSRIAQEHSVYRYPGLVSVDQEQNCVCINIPKLDIMDTAKQIFGQADGMKYMDRSDYDDGEPGSMPPENQPQEDQQLQNGVQNQQGENEQGQNQQGENQQGQQGQQSQQKLPGGQTQQNQQTQQAN